MHTQYFIINKRNKRQIIKNIGKILPDIQGPILPQTLIIEPINLRNLPRLMIAPQQYNPILIAYLVDQQQQKCLNTIEPTIYKITKKQICNKRWLSSDFE